MNKRLHKALLLTFFLTSIGQFAYACVDDHPSDQQSSHVCCCDDVVVKAGNGCDMDMSAPMADAEPCCAIDFQVSNSDGSKADSVYAQHGKPPDFKPQPGVDSPALLSSHNLIAQAHTLRVLQGSQANTFSPHQSGRSLYLDTLRLRI